MSSSDILTKLYFGDQIRRFTISRTTDFKAFLELIKEFYPRLVKDEKLPILKYEDEEGEYVTFSTDLEWKECLKQDLKVLRIKLEKRVSTSKKTEKSLEFPTKPGDYVVELSPEEVTRYLQTGVIQLDKPSGHVNIICDGCNAAGFTGDRYTCKNCFDFDYCEKCFKNKSCCHFGGKHEFNCIKSGSVCPFGQVVAHIVNDDGDEKLDKKTLKKVEKEIKKQEKLEMKEIKKQEKLELKEMKKEIRQAKKEEKKPVSKPIEDKAVVEDKKQEVKVVPLYPKVEEVVKIAPSAPKLEFVDEREEKFNIHYKILENMGFKDIAVCTRLLKKHNGNLQKVVDELLQSQ